MGDGIGQVGNPGNNPFTGGVTDGIVIESNNTDVFAALGSAKLQGDEDTLTIEVSGEIALVSVSGHYGGNGRIAEAGVNHDTYSGTFGINGDYNKDNKVDIVDFGIFGDNYGLSAAGAGSGSAVPCYPPTPW